MKRVVSIKATSRDKWMDSITVEAKINLSNINKPGYRPHQDKVDEVRNALFDAVRGLGFSVSEINTQA